MLCLTARDRRCKHRGCAPSRSCVLEGSSARPARGRVLGGDLRGGPHACALPRLRCGRPGHRAVGGPVGGEWAIEKTRPLPASSSTREGTSSPAAMSSTGGHPPVVVKPKQSRSCSSMGARSRQSWSAWTPGATWRSCGCGSRPAISPPPASVIRTRRRSGNGCSRSAVRWGSTRPSPSGSSAAGHRSTKRAAAPQRRYLLTDANVNPGDSGGPLVDLDGRGDRADHRDQRRSGRQLRIRRPDQPRPARGRFPHQRRARACILTLASACAISRDLRSQRAAHPGGNPRKRCSGESGLA